MNEELHLPNLTSRQEDILTCIVQAYSENPERSGPVNLVENYQLNISSATVRKEMSRLEEMGYIAAPHTSAGACQQRPASAILCAACCKRAI